jgi:hypothetical protein
MNMEAIGDALAKVLPALRTKLQLAGLSVIVVTYLLVHFAKPGNSSAMLTGGAMGVSIIVFAQLFHFLRDFPSQSRASIFLGSFGMFCGLVIALLVATVLLLSKPSMDVTLEPLNQNESVVGWGRPVQDATREFSRLWRSAVAEDLSKPFMSDNVDGDEYLLPLSEKLGTGVRYQMSEKGGTVEITASMPYMKKMRGEGYIIPLTINAFRWVPPILSFKINNPRSQPILLSQARIDAIKLTHNPEPILIVNDVDVYHGHASLEFYNVGWGLLRNPIVKFSLVRYSDMDTAAAGPFQYTAPMDILDEGAIGLDIIGYIDSKTPRERVETRRVEGAFADIMDGRYLEYAIIVGQLSFQNEQRESRLTNFRATLYFQAMPGPGRINPSYKYNILLPEHQQDFPLSVSISQCVASHSADNFLVAFQSPKSARYDLNVDVLSTDGIVLSKHIVLHTLVGRYYGTAHPQETKAFFPSTREGCT